MMQASSHLVGIAGIGNLKSGLLGGRLGRAGPAHDLLLDVAEGDAVLPTGMGRNRLHLYLRRCTLV